MPTWAKSTCLNTTPSKVVCSFFCVHDPVSHYSLLVASMHASSPPLAMSASPMEPMHRPVSERIMNILSGGHDAFSSGDEHESLSDVPFESTPSASNDCIVMAGGRVRKTDRRPRRQRAVAADVNSRLTKASASQQAAAELLFTPFQFPFERKLGYLRYAEPQCKQLRLLYKKCLLLYREEPEDVSLMVSWHEPEPS